MKIHIIRHAESVANVKEILGGQLPFPLTTKGEKDAIRIAAWYTSRYNPQVIYSSPLLRATQTAAPFRVREDIPYIEDDRLKEQNIGIFQGYSYKDAEAHPLYETNRGNRWDWNIENGESYKDVAKRITSFFNDLDPTGPDTLIVTHGVAMRLMRAVLENTLPIYPEKLSQNGEIWEVDYQGVGVVHTIKSLFVEEVTYSGHRA